MKINNSPSSHINPKGGIGKYEGIIFLFILIVFFYPIASKMGLQNMLSTIMATAHDLLLNTVFYIMAITVISGALCDLMIEFGVVRLLQKILSPLMKPLFNLPGVASLGGLLTFLSDNPAIITLSHNKDFRKYFKDYQLLSLTNFGTAFGMGLIVITFMMSKGFFVESFIGLTGAIFGAIISTRLMQYLILKDFSKKETSIVKEEFNTELEKESTEDLVIVKETLIMRFLNSILNGGKNGVNLGLAIIPGVLIISTFIMLITFNVKDPSIGYQGLAYEGVPLLPAFASHFQIIFKFLLGFETAELVAFPITSLGSVGAALSLLTTFINKGIAHSNEIAVFTAMGMCWSGYLSTHSAMLDVLERRNLTTKALISHTIGGLFAGAVAHYIYLIYSMFL